jgi:hypothetical protein
VLVLALSGAWRWLWAGPDTDIVTAHLLDPALLEIWESREAAVEVLWRLPLAQPTNAPLHPVLPDGCREVSAPSVNRTGQSVTIHWRLACDSRRLVGARIGVQGLRERQTDALLRVHLADGRLIQAVLRGDSPFLTVPERASPLDVVSGCSNASRRSSSNDSPTYPTWPTVGRRPAK